MKKITVSQDKNPLDIIASMSEETKNAWIFMHEDVVSRIRVLAYAKITRWNGKETFNFNSEITPPGRIVRVSPVFTKWFILEEVTVADDIAFKTIPADPEEIFVMTMEE